MPALQSVNNTGFTTVINYPQLLISTSLTPYKSTKKYNNYVLRTNKSSKSADKVLKTDIKEKWLSLQFFRENIKHD